MTTQDISKNYNKDTPGSLPKENKVFQDLLLLNDLCMYDKNIVL